MKKNIKLIIVDDSKTMRGYIKNLVTQKSNVMNFEVIAEVDNGATAVRAIKHLKPDLVTLDLIMPKMNGFDAIPAMLAAYPDLKILVISSLSDISTSLSAIESGAHGFVQKPFSRAELESKITDIFSND